MGLWMLADSASPGFRHLPEAEYLHPMQCGFQAVEVEVVLVLAHIQA